MGILKRKKKIKKKKVISPYYKSYDMKWLKNEKSHPDFGLVAEYEKKNGIILWAKQEIMFLE